MISVPLGVMTAVFLNEVKGPLVRPVRIFVDAMSGVPSIVAGLFIYAVWIVQFGHGFSGFAASLALAVLMLPTITRTAEEVLRLVPDGLREASLALAHRNGERRCASSCQLREVALITAVILGVARAVGETAPLIMTSFGATTMNVNPFDGAQASLPLSVYQLVSNPFASQQERAYAGAFILILTVLALFTLARLLTQAQAPHFTTQVRNSQEEKVTAVIDFTDNHPPRVVSGGMVAEDVSAWFGQRKVLDRVNLAMPAQTVTALIGPSGCGKSTFLRILNRMHELVPGSSLAGQVLLDGEDVYNPELKATHTRKRVGMVFQKPNPFPSMSIRDNVLSGLRLAGQPIIDADATVESALTAAGLWREVMDRLEQPGGALSGGQQQRLCIARSLAVAPEVLLMDEPCSALDPTSTRRIEETIAEISSR